jgi:hypothetical protein
MLTHLLPPVHIKKLTTEYTEKAIISKKKAVLVSSPSVSSSYDAKLHSKIPLNPPFPKGENLFPSFVKRGEGRF